MALPPGVLPLTPELEAAATNQQRARPRAAKAPSTGVRAAPAAPEAERQPEPEGAPISDIDETSGAPLSLRFMAGKQFDKAGVGRYLAEKLGADNVMPMMGEDGTVDNFVIRDGPQTQWKVYDPKPQGILSAIKDIPGDIADISGDIIEGGAQALGAAGGAMIGGLAGPAGAIGGAIAGGWGTGVLANAERQAEVAAMPGAQPEPVLGRAVQAAEAANMGVVAEGGGRFIGSAAKGAAKQLRKIISRRYGNAQRFFGEAVPGNAHEALTGTGKTGAESAAEGLALQGRLGQRMGEEVSLSAGQLSGARKALGFEELVRSNTDTIDKAFAVDVDRNLQMARGFDSLIESISKGEVSGKKALDMAGSAYNIYRESLINLRAEQAAADFGRVALESGGKKVFSIRHALEALDELSGAKDGVGPSGSSVTAKYVNDIKDRFLEKAGIDWAHAMSGEPALTAREMQRTLELWGKAASKGEDITLPVSVGGGQRASVRLDRSETQRIAKLVFGSLQQSLDEAAEQGGPGAELLKKARNAYRANSTVIEQSEQAFGERALDLATAGRSSVGPGELLKKTPEEIESFFDVLSKTEVGQDAAFKLRGSVLREIVEGATKNTPGTAGSGGMVSPADLSTALWKNRRKLGAMMPEGADREYLKDLTELANRLRRVDVFGGRSRTEPMRQANLDVRGVFSQETAWRAGAKAIETVARKLRILQTPDGMFRALNDPEQIKMMLKLVGPRSYDRPIEETSKLLSRILGAQAASLGTKGKTDELNKILEAMGQEEAKE